MKRPQYSEGTWFAVPLRTGGFATGVVARMAPRGKIILACFFGPKRAAVPDLPDIERLQKIDAIKCIRLGDLGLVNGEWPIIGISPIWVRAEWSIPIFIRRDPLSRQAWLVRYSDTDPSIVEQECIVNDEVDNIEDDCLCGYGAVEIKLTKLLA